MSFLEAYTISLSPAAISEQRGLDGVVPHPQPQEAETRVGA